MRWCRLTNVPYVESGKGTQVVNMQKNRMQSFQSVQQFLDEKLVDL
jgi:hypothetical protein